MAPMRELDKQTVSFVRRFREQPKLEKNFLVELVRGTKEGEDLVHSGIKNRVETQPREC